MTFRTGSPNIITFPDKLVSENYNTSRAGGTDTVTIRRERAEGLSPSAALPVALVLSRSSEGADGTTSVHPGDRACTSTLWLPADRGDVETGRRRAQP